MGLKRQFGNLLRRFGYDKVTPTPLPEALERRKRLFNTYRVDLILDVGANSGQYARQMRNKLGFTGQIVSFEPLRSAFRELTLAAHGDPKWTPIQCGLGDSIGKKILNVSGNSYSSSILGMLSSHETAAPDSRYTGQETIEIKTLDSIFSEYCPTSSCPCLKIDTQGYERQVLAGAERSLKYISMIQLELSLVPLYEGEMLFAEMMGFLSEIGYDLISLEPGFEDPHSGRLLQCDGIFLRR